MIASPRGGVNTQRYLPIATYIYLDDGTLMGVSIRCAYCYVGSVAPIIQIAHSTVNDHHCPVERERFLEWKKRRMRR